MAIAASTVASGVISIVRWAIPRERRSKGEREIGARRGHGKPPAGGNSHQAPIFEAAGAQAKSLENRAALPAKEAAFPRNPAPAKKSKELLHSPPTSIYRLAPATEHAEKRSAGVAGGRA